MRVLSWGPDSLPAVPLVSILRQGRNSVKVS